MVRIAALAIIVLASTANAQNRYLVRFKDGAQGKAALHAAGASIALDLGPQRAAAAYVPAHALPALRSNPNIELIEPDPVRQPLAQTTPYGISMVQADQIPTSGMVTNRTVCIIDSGFYAGHEDLQTTSVAGEPLGWNTDGCGHGTHVAGTIAALTNSTGVKGVLPYGVRLHIVKVFGDNCSWNFASGLVDALNKCRNAGANVVSMSLGGSTSSTIEQSAFQDAWNGGIISVAAAGNSGNATFSYPASYPSVISVAALDSNKNVAAFSQHNSAVDVAAPGVAVVSTIPWKELNTLAVSGVTYSGTYISGGTRTSGMSGTLVDGGLCDSVGAWSGKVVMCKRGAILFSAKATNVSNGGGIAAVIYNDYPGTFSGTMSATAAIPVIGLSKEDGDYIMANRLNLSGTVLSQQTKPGNGYEAWNGTSMATPHVSAVAALLWSQNTGWTHTQIRQALEATALDLGTPGRDDSYGHGLIQAKAALAYLQGNTSNNNPPLALFAYTCTALTCTFTDNSTDSDGLLVNWSWSLGDGSASLAQNPTHSFPAAGTYTVRLTVTDDVGATSTATSVVTLSTETVPTNRAPVAMFSYSCVGLSCTFKDASTDSDGTITGWTWDFRDGGVSILQHPSRTFAASGTYNVSLTAKDNGGATNTYSMAVLVSGTSANNPPLASFVHACTGLTCTFTDRSTDSDGTITGWTWDFGDGGVSILQHPSRTFAASGTYTVRLTARDNAGATNTNTVSISVSGPTPNNPPVASFAHSCTGLSCAFTDASTDPDGAIASRLWSFGDGNSSSTQHPSHAYAAAGTYTVTLTVTDNAGAAASVTKAITVSGGGRISISARGYKVKGLQKADLGWAGASASNVDVYRNGARIVTTPNDAAYVDDINGKGSESYTYKICDAGTVTCSDNAVVVF
jgi:serine protease